MPKNIFPSLCRAYLFLMNNPSMKAFPLNLWTTNLKHIADRVVVFYFHLQIHVMSCHVIYKAATFNKWPVKFENDTINESNRSHPKKRLYVLIILTWCSYCLLEYSKMRAYLALKCRIWWYHKSIAMVSISWLYPCDKSSYTRFVYTQYHVD